MPQKVLIAWSADPALGDQLPAALASIGGDFGIVANNLPGTLPPGFVPGRDSLPSGFLGSVIVDATLSEVHGQASQVTEHQVEFGTNVADHIRPLPERLSLECFISNAPLGLPDGPQGDGVTGSLRTVRQTVGDRVVSFQAFQFDSPFNRVKSVYGDVVSGIQAGALFTVVTTLRQYSNLAVVSFSGRRAANLGDALSFSVEFQALRFVSSETVDAIPPKAQTGKRGPKPTAALDPNKAQDKTKVQQSEGLVHSLVSAIRGSTGNVFE